MPHLVLSGEVKLGDIASQISPEVHRWGTAVLKTEAVWCRSDGEALLVEGVVVEHSRPLHPVAVTIQNIPTPKRRFIWVFSFLIKGLSPTLCSEAGVGERSAMQRPGPLCVFNSYDSAACRSWTEWAPENCVPVLR